MDETHNIERVRVDQVWQKPDGTASVRIGRVWASEHFCGGGTFVRCHPIRGGKVWFTTIEEFLKRYEVRTATHLPHNDG